jgi:hypothetical protein
VVLARLEPFSGSKRASAAGKSAPIAASGNLLAINQSFSLEKADRDGL